ncbi:MAG: HEAT repeat domain-containing protein [Gemmatimonadaceae bacterium]
MSPGGSGSVGVFTTDRALVVRSWDSWLTVGTGIAEIDAVGSTLSELFPDLVTRGLLARLQRVASSGSAEVLATAFHGYLLSCPPREPSVHFDRMQQHVTISPMLDLTGGVIGVVVTIEDVTARRDRERVLAEQLKSSDDAVRLKAVRAIESVDEGLGDALVGVLGDRSWRVRRAAAEGLARGHIVSVRDQLLATLQERHRDPAVLNAALTALIRAEQDVVPPLVALLDPADPDDDLRTYAALALGLLEDSRAVPALVKTLDDANANVRFHAIEALGRVRSRASAMAVAAIAETRDFSVAFAALDTLAMIGEPSVAPRILPLLEDDLLQTAAADALGRLGSEDAIVPLSALVDRDASLAATVANALAQLSNRLDGASVSSGGSVAELARAVITPRAAQHLLDAVAGATDTEIEGLLVVLGWLQHDGIDSALAQSLVRPDARRLAADILAQRGAPAVDALLELLSADDIDVRKAAVATLGNIGATSAVPALLHLLHDDPDLAIVAAGALRSIGDRSAFEPLLEHLDSPQSGVRHAVVAALNSIGHPDLGVRAVELLRHESAHVREGAARLTGYLGHPGGAEALLARAGDSDESVRRTVVEQLAHFDDSRAVDAIRLALQTGTSGVRAAAARALGHANAMDALSLLLDACDDADPWVRYYAARSLGHRGQGDAVGTLLRLATKDDVPPVRIASVDALAEIRTPEALNALRAFVGDEDSAIARPALLALGQSSDPATLLPLIDALGRRDRERQLAALEALSRRGSGEGVVEAIARVARNSKDDVVAERAVATLAAVASANSVEALVALAEDPQRAAVIVDALATLGTPHIDWLRSALTHPDVSVRCVVIEALGRIGDNGAGAAVVASALNDQSDVVRAAAAHALSRIDVRGVMGG